MHKEAYHLALQATAGALPIDLPDADSGIVPACCDLTRISAAPGCPRHFSAVSLQHKWLITSSINLHSLHCVLLLPACLLLVQSSYSKAASRLLTGQLRSSSACCMAGIQRQR